MEGSEEMDPAEGLSGGEGKALIGDSGRLESWG